MQFLGFLIECRFQAVILTNRMYHKINISYSSFQFVTHETQGFGHHRLLRIDFIISLR